MAIELVFESHSTSTDNEQGHATGWLPGQLSEQGRMQARQLGQRRRDDGITAVFSSDLTRAAQTASAALGASAIPILYELAAARMRLRAAQWDARGGTAGPGVSTSTSPTPAARAGGRPSPGSAGSWPTCHCGVERAADPRHRPRRHPMGLGPRHLRRPAGRPRCAGLRLARRMGVPDQLTRCGV